MSFIETSFNLRGQKIAAKVWHQGASLPVLALHGWLDNAGSFDRLAPLLPDANIVALDLPGHGYSSHQAASSTIHLIDYVENIIQVANQLGWQEFVLLGHSLGAALSSLIAGTIPARIKGLALIDGLAPFTTSASHTPTQLRHYINAVTAKPNKASPQYASQEQALLTRLKVTPMSIESGWCLIKRGTQQIANGQWIWRTDPKLLLPSPIQLTQEQVVAFLQAITAPVCIIRAEPGFPFPPDMMATYIKSLKSLTLFHLPGEHHIHLDMPEKVAAYLLPFLRELK